MTMSDEQRTIDPESGKEIRLTDNGLKEGDLEAPQHARPLTEDEIAELVGKAVDNGNG